MVHGRLDAAEKERWRALLAEPPLVHRPAVWLDPELAILVCAILVFVALLLATFDPLAHAPPWLVLAARGVLAALMLACLRVALFLRRAGSAWTNGRALHTWGYVEIEHDVLRAIPMADLELELRGRRLGVGPVRLTLHSGRWTRTLALAPAELARIAQHLEAGVHADLAQTAYRGGDRVLVGTATPRRLSRRSWDVALVGLGTAVLLALPRLPEAPPTASAPVPVPVASSTVERPALSYDLGGCAPSYVVVSSIASYLALGLERRHLGPASTAPLAPVREHAAGTRVLRARCTWQVDPSTGLFSHADARWDVMPPGGARSVARATVRTDDVLGVITGCERLPPRVRLSPLTLARASAALLQQTIALDLRYAAEVPEASPALSLCVAERAQAVRVEHGTAL